MYISDKHIHTHIFRNPCPSDKIFVDTSIVNMYNLVSHDSGVIFIDM